MFVVYDIVTLIGAKRTTQLQLTGLWSRSRRLGLGYLRLVPKDQCINSFLMGMQMAPYTV